MPTVSILVKALNEERRIAQCLQAAVREAALVDGEVIVVDSLSTDRTVAIAKQFAVRIVQFDALADRGCGAAVQLGYQYARGEFVYVLDADMVLQPGFLTLALSYLHENIDLAGVGGKVRDTALRTVADYRRHSTAETQSANSFVNELGGGGLYRVAAVTETGYLAHRGLAAYEEAELGARLRSCGWRLLRLVNTAVLHEGHAENDWQMLKRQWRNGRAQANGAVLRAALGRRWFWRLARKQAFVLAAPALHSLATVIAVLVGDGMASASVAWGVSWVTVWSLVAVRKKGAINSLRTLLLWHYSSLAALIGVLRPVVDPFGPVAGHELSL